MAYPFIPSPPSEHWPRTAPIRAIAIHHAEGGGTVGWLQRPDGNSSHYVVEYTGRIVQMVKEDRAAGSINPKLIRTSDDPAFTYLGESIVYGITANRAALGDHWRNPNAAVIAIEVEGFARNGPNGAQRGSLRTLVADIRTRHPDLPALGHRDWQSYKACPGKLIPWADYGGHGAPSQEEDVAIRSKVIDPTPGLATVTGANHALVTFEGRHVAVPDGQQREVIAKVSLLEPLDDNPGDRSTAYLVGAVPGQPNSELAYLLAVDGTFVPDPTAVTAVAAAREKDRAAHLANVEEVYA